MPASQHLMEAVEAIELLIGFKQKTILGPDSINFIWSTPFEMLASV